ncbi:MAG: hypothetical protein ACLQF0_05535 [Dissulfurispiraceae bacterium]
MPIPSELKCFVKPGLEGFIEKYSTTPEQMVRMIAEDVIRNSLNSHNSDDALKASTMARSILQAAEKLSYACRAAVVEVIESVL